MGAPPSLSGAVQVTTMSPVPSAWASEMRGADGRPGTTAVTVTASLVPAEFVALMETSYEEPTTRPEVMSAVVSELAKVAVARCVVVPESTTRTL